MIRSFVVIFWRMEVTEFPDGLDVGCERKQSKGVSKQLILRWVRYGHWKD